MKPVRLTRHARNRLRLWHLADDVIIDAIASPDIVTPSVRGRGNAWKLSDGRWIRVTFIDEGAEIVVVTVTIRRRGPEGA